MRSYALELNKKIYKFLRANFDFYEWLVNHSAGLYSIIPRHQAVVYAEYRYLENL
jgi:hypothetical protein